MVVSRDRSRLAEFARAGNGSPVRDDDHVGRGRSRPRFSGPVLTGPSHLSSRGEEVVVPTTTSRRLPPAPPSRTTTSRTTTSGNPVCLRSLARRQFRQSPWIVRKPGAVRLAVPASPQRA